MYETLYRHLLFPIFEGWFHRRKTLDYWNQANESQWWDRERLVNQQRANLLQLLLHANRCSPFYRDQWASIGFEPNRYVGHHPQDSALWFDQFLKLPMLERETVRAHRNQLRSQALEFQSKGSLITKSTGGSTGTPLVFDLNLDSNDRRVAMTIRGYGWANCLPGTRVSSLWGSDLKMSSKLRSWKHALHRRFQNQQLLPCFKLDSATMQKYYCTICEYRPKSIVAYTNAIYEFARFLDSEKLRPPAIRSIIVGAEKLYVHQRQLIEEVFHAPVFETYGSREFMLIGAECPEHRGMHLSMENLLVEILNDDGTTTANGLEGNIVITVLFNYGMPFVRYRNGDRAVAGFSSCACGRGLPLLQPVTGRQLDILESPSGEKLPGELFPHFFKDYPSIQRFQVIQVSPDQLEIRFVMASNASEADAIAIESAKIELRKHVPSDLQVVWHKNDDIQRTTSGKLQVVVNQWRRSSQLH